MTSSLKMLPSTNKFYQESCPTTMAGTISHLPRSVHRNTLPFLSVATKAPVASG